MLGVIVLIAYAALMIGATVIFTRRTHDAESFHVADRRIGTGVAAMSIAATLDMGPFSFCVGGKGIYQRHSGSVLVLGAECAVPDYLHPHSQSG